MAKSRGGPSALLPFRAGNGKDGNRQGEDGHNQRGEKKSDRLLVQMTTPPNITFQSGLSTLMIGETTDTAKNTVPALSKILDNRENWSAVNTGFRWMYITPESFIDTNDSMRSRYSSTNLSLLPPPFASGFGVARRVYAADGSAPSGGGGRCSFIKNVVVPAVKQIESFTRNYLWRSPWKVIAGKEAFLFFLPIEDCGYVLGHPSLRKTFPFFEERYRECEEENKPEMCEDCGDANSNCEFWSTIHGYPPMSAK